jgi:hypothetical protein
VQLALVTVAIKKKGPTPDLDTFWTKCHRLTKFLV